MRSVLALGLLVAVGAFAQAARAHHHHSRHHVFIRPGAASSFAAAPGWVYEPLRPPIRYHGAPSYNDPSKFGGKEALPIQ
jgi:hypothetical protein